MKLKLERIQRDSDVTIGQLFVDGEFECWMLEDTVREVPGVAVNSWKVYGATAIPYGTYKVILNMSTRFKTVLPLLVDVPGFSGIRIHPGNTQHDTEGCLLPGADKLAKSVGRSRVAFNALMEKLAAAQKAGEPITIEIVPGVPKSTWAPDPVKAAPAPAKPAGKK